MNKTGLPEDAHWETHNKVHYFVSREVDDVKIFGWVEDQARLVEEGDNQFRAGHPVPLNPEIDSDSMYIGHFPTLDKAQKAVQKANPAPNGWYETEFLYG